VLRFRHIPLVACLIAATVPALAGPPSGTSWGKANVSLRQFADDANACAATSRGVAVSIKPGTLRALDALSSAQLLQMAMDSTAPGSPVDPMAVASDISATHAEADVARRSNTFGGRFVASTTEDVSGELQAALDACLMERGYVRIRLTNEQMKALSHLRHRSAERTAYLHAIDSDPAVVDRQRLVPAP
jgi:hypothetical protein